METMITVGLIIVSVLTSLVTESIKKILDELEKNYSANLLAGIVAVVLSAAYGVGYAILSEISISAALIVYLICLVFLSWLCAMTGYDKVKQAIEQITSED